MKDLQALNQIKDSVRLLYEASLAKKKAEEHYKEVKNKEQLKISNFMFTNLPTDENSFRIVLDEGINYYSEHKNLSVARVRKKEIIWDLDKLKKKLGHKMFRSVTDRAYSVNDMEGLIKYLKTCGVDPKKFKKYIDVEETLDETKLNTLYETGVISKKEIAGCYELKMGEPYIKLTELKG